MLSIVEVALLWSGTPEGTATLRHNLHNVVGRLGLFRGGGHDAKGEPVKEKRQNLVVSYQLRIFLAKYFESYLKGPLYFDDLVVPVAMRNVSVAKKVTANNPHIRAVFGDHSYLPENSRELQGQIQGQQVLGPDGFLEIMKLSRILGSQFNIERIFEA